MADERIDIEIVDKISGSIGKKLSEIAENARVANAHVNRLKDALYAVKASGVSKISSEMAKAEAATAKAALAQAKLATETNKAAATAQNAANKSAIAQQKLATEAKKTAIAEAKLATSMSNQAAAASRAEMASMRLASANAKAAKEANSSSFNFGAMKAQLLGVAAALGSVYAALSMADQYNQLQNRLRATGLEGEGLKRVMQELTDSTNNTRSSLAGTVELYSRLAISSKELGVTEKDLVQFTTSLNQAIILSGASAEEAQAGLIQLSQGMASGTLRGDELRSVLEQLPAVADVIAKSMGVTRGQLREMGAEGKISAQTILQAFKEAGPELGEKFAGQATTAGQAMELLKNKAVELSGKEGSGSVTQFTGAVNDLITALDHLEKNNTLEAIGFVFESIAKVVRLAVLTIELAFTYVLPSLLSGFNKVLSQFMSGPLTALAAISDAIGLEFGAKLKALNDDFAKGAYDMGKNAEQAFRDGLKSFEDIYAYEPPQAGGETPESVKAYGIERRKREAEEAKRREEEAKRREEEAKRAAEIAKKAAEEDAKWRQQSNEAAESAYRAALEKADATAKAYADINAELANMKTVLGMTDKELAIHNQMLDYSSRVAGTRGSDEFLKNAREQLSELYDQNEALERQKTIMESVKRTDFGTAMSDLQALSSSGKLSRAGAQDYLIAQNPDLFAGTMEAAEANVRTYEDMYARINAMREAQMVSESTASQMRTKVWVLENEAKAQAASDFFGNFAALSASTNKKLFTAGKAAAVAQATIDGILAVQKALAAYPPPINGAMAASVGVASAANVAKITGVAGFQDGGYTGNGGVSEVAGVVHGREYVMDAATVQRVGVDNLQAIQNGASIGGASQQNIRVVNVIDPGMIEDWMATPSGEKAILNIIRNNSDAISQTVNT